MSELNHEVQITTRKVGDVTVVQLNERKILDELSADNLGQKLLALVEGAGVRKMVLSFQNVGALSSAAIAKLFHLHKRLVEELKGHMILCAIPEHIQDVFQIMCLDRKFTIVPSESEALRGF
jgi:anti-anti-sigma factor